MGEPAALKRELAGRPLLDLESSNPLGSMQILERLDSVAEVAVFGSGLHVSLREPPAAAMPAIRRALQDSGITVNRLEAIDPSMEDIFVATIEAEQRKEP